MSFQVAPVLQWFKKQSLTEPNLWSPMYKAKVYAEIHMSVVVDSLGVYEYFNSTYRPQPCEHGLGELQGASTGFLPSIMIHSIGGWF